MKLSIAVSTYECHGKGWLYLSELLNSIVKQSEKNIEVVVSDQSTDSKIFDLCSFYSKQIDLKYVSGHHLKRSNSPNTNNAILNCSSDYIKIMFQDDFFVDDDALGRVKKAFESGAKWIVSGSLHCNSIHFLGRPKVPYYNFQILEGINTISSPSVLAYYGKELFDENLIMLMDCDIYKRLYDKYGEPYIIENLDVCNRVHENQLQFTQQDKLSSEIEYCKNKFKG